MSRNFDRAVEIKNRIDFYMNDPVPEADELDMLQAIFDALEAEVSEANELDEEEEVTLTPAYDMDSEFNEFSTRADDEYGESQLGTFVGHPADEEQGQVGRIETTIFPQQPYTSHITRLRQAVENGGVRFNTGKTLDEVFGSCGAD